jgi:putative transposase
MKPCFGAFFHPIAECAHGKQWKADYIIGFYNCKRFHSVLGNLSPAVYERKMAANPIVVSDIT